MVLKPFNIANAELIDVGNTTVLFFFDSKSPLFGCFALNFVFDCEVCFDHVVKENNELARVAYRGVRENLLDLGSIVLTKGVHAILVCEKLKNHLGLFEVRLRVFAVFCVICDPLCHFCVVIQVFPVDLAELLESAQDISVVKKQVEVVLDTQLENQADLVEELAFHVIDELER